MIPAYADSRVFLSTSRPRRSSCHDITRCSPLDKRGRGQPERFFDPNFASILHPCGCITAHRLLFPVQTPFILRIIQQLMGRVLLKVTSPSGSPGAPASITHPDPPRLSFSATAGAYLLLLVISGSTPAAVDADTDILAPSTHAASARRR